VAAGIAALALVGSAVVAQAEVGHHHATTTAAVSVRASTPTSMGSMSSWSDAPRHMGNGDLMYGTWERHAIAVPAALRPPAGSRLTSILQGRGVLVYTCKAGTFTLTEPLINLFSTAGRPSGLHFTVANPAAPLVWGSSVDGSRADMAIVREIPTRMTVTRVLLRAVTTAGGPRTTFGGTTSIIRLPVTGGVPPARCTVAGQRIGVAFLTLYLVFKGGHVTAVTSSH
jgi:hypothetical protein